MLSSVTSDSRYTQAYPLHSSISITAPTWIRITAVVIQEAEQNRCWRQIYVAWTSCYFSVAICVVICIVFNLLGVLVTYFHINLIIC